MTETHQLLGKIAALRQRLEQAQALAREAGSTAAVLVNHDPAAAGCATFAGYLAAAADHDTLLDQAVRGWGGPALPVDAPLPRQLTSRARRVLERAAELLARLRQLAAVYAPDAALEGPSAQRDQPLRRLYRETLAMTDSALRLVPLFPDRAGAQLGLCEGLEATLEVVAERVQTLASAAQRLDQASAQVDRLAGLLAGLESGRAAAVGPLLELVEEVLAETQEGKPLRFQEDETGEPAKLVACHSLNVARVLARVIRHDPDLKTRATEGVLAALVHDAGMLRVPAALLAQPGPLDAEQRRLVEGHCRAGASLAALLLPDTAWLAEAAAGHHERLDGTGYPDGLREFHLSPLVRLLAVCDTYAALVCRRPQRPARDTRTALTDTLLLAEQGQLDRAHAERLLTLSFYPVGTAVELADGSVGVVVAAPRQSHTLTSPARPVVALLLDGNGERLAPPSVVDLTECDRSSVVRTLPVRERREVLGRSYPEWC